MNIRKFRHLLPAFLFLSALFLSAGSAETVRAEDLEIGSAAPLFTAANQDGVPFSLADRKGRGWSVLYFYPKADTPGCTKQACAFRDAVKKIQALNAEVYGVSTDTVESQAQFHKKYQLKFDILADPDGVVVSLYGAKMPMVDYAKRWTFIIDPELKIRAIEKDVDPASDAERVAGILAGLQSKTTELAPGGE